MVGFQKPIIGPLPMLKFSILETDKNVIVNLPKAYANDVDCDSGIALDKFEKRLPFN